MSRSLTVVRLLVWVAVGSLTTATGYFVVDELQTSKLQARYLAEVGKNSSFTLAEGVSPVTRYPHEGPYDQRLGYVDLPQYLQRLTRGHMAVTAQARLSPTLIKVADAGLNLPYFEKQQAGLRILDRDGKVLFDNPYPRRVYPQFEAVPPIVLNSLLFIENRELLSNKAPQQNPAVEWDRLSRASLELVMRKLGAKVHVAGGSTLATQIEKYRHSPGGRTDSAVDKVLQMGSASLRAYLSGRDTTSARRAIALAYLNSMPLGSAPASGEVHGLGDGLAAWYAADFGSVNHLLGSANIYSGEHISADQAHAYRMVLGLLIAQRRPAFYLGRNHDALEAQIDRHLRVLAHQKIIPTALRDLALQQRTPRPPSRADQAPGEAFAQHKTESVLRARLAGDLGIGRLYDLDRIDLTANTTLDYATQQSVIQALKQLKSVDHAKAAGLFGFRLLNDTTDLSPIVFSLLLYERSANGNLLRIQADNFDKPLDVNDGIRLDLGSTAKMRTMVHYLEIIAQLHTQYVGKSPAELRKLDLAPRDHLSLWVVDQLITKPNQSLQDLVRAALDRRYSAGPGEQFFTGGGAHHFANFDPDDNGRVMTVRDALRNSVNLVFVRLMRDIVYHHLYKPGGVARWIEAEETVHRAEYLQRFADEEGRAFLRRFYRKYHGKTPDTLLDAFVHEIRPMPKRLATVFRSVYPGKDVQALTEFLHRYQAADGLPDRSINELYEKYAPQNFSLQDRGYIARVHPLELWLVAYLLQHPDVSLNDALAASTKERQEVYQWLFKSSRKHAQDRRIQTLLEMEAFQQVHTAWRRLGYPFETLTPSYATALGASGDRPAALAELMGILANDGLRLPAVRYGSLQFAAGTPFETRLESHVSEPQQVLPREVVIAAREALANVVENGTAARLRGVYRTPDGVKMVVAGKTGTGDHRREFFGSHGRVLAQQVISRTATFAFLLGEHFYGVLTAYVEGPKAGNYRFTSALPTQVLKSLEPKLAPLVGRAYSKPATTPQSILAVSATTAATPR
jgi:membrane peptidoglycan carboxypeptidase